MGTANLHDRLSFNDSWAELVDSPSAFRSAVREFLDNGVRRFVISDALNGRMIRDPENWAGKLLAPPGGYSIRRLVDTFRWLGF